MFIDPISYYFEAGSTRLTENTRTRLDALARLAVEQDRFQLLLMGHADSTESSASNLSLSCRRARSVRTHLIARGVAAERILVEGHGEERPLVDRGSNAAEPDNRRVDILFVNDGVIAEWRRRAGRGLAC